MKKNLFVSFSLLFALFALLSCGNNPVPEPDPQPEPVVDLLSDIHAFDGTLINADEADGLIDEIVLLAALVDNTSDTVLRLPYTDGRIVMTLPESLPDEILFPITEIDLDFQYSNPTTKLTEVLILGMKNNQEIGEIMPMVDYGDSYVALVYANHSTTMTSTAGVQHILKKGWNFLIQSPDGDEDYALSIVSALPATLMWYFVYD